MVVAPGDFIAASYYLEYGKKEFLPVPLPTAGYCLLGMSLCSWFYAELVFYRKWGTGQSIKCGKIHLSDVIGHKYCILAGMAG